ncbi:M48 family metallopeptidase [Flavobacterium sp. N2038]|uniref:M48 family metallopeptidase n=1 Tax=Flavobacterium sp. N2038 TaxID=2986829 RepID=UPI002224591B|nr:M48 family metallopeptidase [Flavobacterium sp. N2038]
MKKIFCFILLLYVGFINSQNKNFKYIPDNKDSLETYISKITNNKIKAFDAVNQKKAKEILLERKEAFLKNIKDSTFIFEKKINKYLQSILAEIYKANSQIDHNDFYFLINKSLIPNAACYGNGIFTVNLGLFNLAESDDEIAFVICHELSHYILKHNDNSLQNYLKTINSKEVKQKINTATNLKYGRRAAVAELLKDLKFNFMKHSRTAEIQADSLGFELFNKTKYNKEASVNMLKKLDLSDEMFFKNPTNLKENFTFTEYPFKDVWIEQEDKIFDTKESVNDFALNKDSTKTHPDIPLRIENILQHHKLTSTAVTKDELQLIKKLIDENSLIIYSDNHKLDILLYQLLSLNVSGKLDSQTFNVTITSLLKKVYQLKENHNFGKYVEPVNVFSEEKNLNEVRLFLNNIELKNIRKIGYYFCVKNESLLGGNIEFQDNYTFFKKLNQN